jgi:hypothetical protein
VEKTGSVRLRNRRGSTTGRSILCGIDNESVHERARTYTHTSAYTRALSYIILRLPSPLGKVHGHKLRRAVPPRVGHRRMAREGPQLRWQVCTDQVMSEINRRAGSRFAFGTRLCGLHRTKHGRLFHLIVAVVGTSRVLGLPLLGQVKTGSVRLRNRANHICRGSTTGRSILCGIDSESVHKRARTHTHTSAYTRA